MKGPTLALLTGVTSLLLAQAAPAFPPPSSGGTGGGTIHFLHLSAYWTMNSDGNNKTALPAGASGEPSRALFGGHCWLLQLRQIPGESYPSHGPSPTRREIFAVRDDGDPALTVQLTTQPDLETNGGFRWVPGLARVSWIARRWAAGQVREGGIFQADLVFDLSGNVAGFAAQPVAPAMPVPLISTTSGLYFGSYFRGDPAPDLYTHDCAPDSIQVVYDRASIRELRIADLYGGNRLLIAATGGNPVWSPAGAKIAYGSLGGIDTINPDGTGVRTIIRSGSNVSVGGPQWSPTGSHLIYSSGNNQFPPTRDVVRSTVDGGSKTNLTANISTDTFPIAWR